MLRPDVFKIAMHLPILVPKLAARLWEILNCSLAIASSHYWQHHSRKI